MNYRDLFIAAMHAGEYRRVAWVISAFSPINEAPDEWKKAPYPYRIVQTTGGHFYVDPEDVTRLLPIEGTKPGQPPMRLMEGIDLEAGTFINQPEAVRTTYGNVIVNNVLLIYPFGNKIPFKTGKFSVNSLKSYIAPRLTKTPAPGEPRDPELIYVDEYERFGNGAFSLGAFSQLCVPAHTEKMLTVPPGTKELRNKLLEQYKGRLHDPAAIAAIDKALVEHYRNWIKGDRSEGFLITDKSIAIVRKKLLLMHGAETGLLESVDVDLVSNSLREGWDIEKLPAMINSLRAGAYNRGLQTELGGVAVKELLRASANIRILPGDCGRKFGKYFEIPEEKKDQIIGYNVIEEDGSITAIDEKNYGAYLGRKIELRTPLYCLFPMTDYCETCVGRNLARSPTATSVGIAAYGNTFLLLFLKAAHAKALKTKKLDWKKHIR